MGLWQLDVTASMFLAGGRECKIITGIDDHSRFGRWLPVTAGETELRRIAAIPVTRYRYRGSQIPDPWTAEPA